MAGYPFDPKQLPEPIHRALFEGGRPFGYQTISETEALLRAEAHPDAHQLICSAYLEWEAAMLTDFDDDALGSAPAALELLDRAQAMGLSAKEAKGVDAYRRRIEKRLAKAKKNQKKTEKLDAEPEASLHIEHAKDLAELLIASRDPAKLAKAVRLYRRIYEEPLEDHPHEPAHSQRLYRLGSLAQALYRSGQHAEAAERLREIVDWPYPEDLQSEGPSRRSFLGRASACNRSKP